MKQSLGARTIVCPHPVLMIGTYDAQDRPNLMAVAWGGICCSDPPCVAVSLREATYTYHNIMARKAFTVGIPTVQQAAQADYVGIYSGRRRDKFAATGLTPVRANAVDAPYAEQFPVVLECTLHQVVKIGLHTQFIGRIVDLRADADVLNDKGLPDLGKVAPLLYSSGDREYFGVGERIGRAFHIGRERKEGDDGIDHE
jgi:flavin reductase (DIM6/NTAB) family NADH-FMN oxidoreductase RutF